MEDRDECFKYKLKEDHHQQLLEPHLDFELIAEEYIKSGTKTIQIKS